MEVILKVLYFERSAPGSWLNKAKKEEDMTDEEGDVAGNHYSGQVWGRVSKPYPGGNG